MERRLFQIAVGMAWLALPLTALNYRRAWDRLPRRVAVHFDINWQPNGWTSREGALMLALGTTVFLLVIFTIACYAMRAAAVSSFARWSLVAVFYGALGFVYCVNNWIVDRSLNQQPSASLRKLVVLCDRDPTLAFPQGLNPTFLLSVSGTAGSRALPEQFVRRVRL
jgi:Protein of unknown function (DUF1648)